MNKFRKLKKCRNDAALSLGNIETYNKAVELQKEHGYTFVHPFDDEDVIEGQGTIALEILEELPDADIILVPVGGGGLISGIACAAKLIKPTAMVNILGERTGKAKNIDTKTLINDPEVSVYIYGKNHTKIDRKMGHINATTGTIEEAKAKAEQARSMIEI